MGWWFGATREDDLNELRKDYDTNPDPKARRLAEEAAHKITSETKSIRDMREALVKAHRRGDKDEVKNIHWDVQHNPKYR